MNSRKTKFNRNAVEKMSFKEFETAYKGLFVDNPDLRELYHENGGKEKEKQKN